MLLLLTLENLTATLRSGNQPKHASFTTISQYLFAKVQILFVNPHFIIKKMCKNGVLRAKKT